MKRPKVVRRRYTREAWSKIEDRAIKALLSLPNGVRATKKILFGLKEIPNEKYWDRIGNFIEDHEKETRP